MALSLKEILAQKALQKTSSPSDKAEAEAEEAPTTVEVEVEKKEETKVAENKGIEIAAAAIAEVKSRMDKTVLIQAEQTVSDILPRIRALKELQTDQLDDEMDYLKEALLANPAAVQLMMPEDVGQLVIALRKITGQALVSASSSSTKKKASSLKKQMKVFTKEELEDLADDL